MLFIIIFITFSGIKPAPRSWQKWNFSELEPKGLRKGEKIQEEAAKGTWSCSNRKINALSVHRACTSKRLLSRVVPQRASCGYIRLAKIPKSSMNTVMLCSC